MKTYGAKDLKKRKRRSDRNKRRKLYRKRPVKKRRKINGKIIYYESKRKKNDPIKIWFWEVKPMKKESMKHFSRDTRHFIVKTTYTPRALLEVNPEEISTRDKVSHICEQDLWEGTWLLKMWGHAKNPFHCSAKAVDIIKIKETPEGLKARVHPSFKNRGLYRYWFWKDR